MYNTGLSIDPEPIGNEAMLPSSVLIAVEGVMNIPVAVLSSSASPVTWLEPSDS